jgi:hypothetical protein
MGQRELPRVHHATNGVNIMIRKVVMALAAVAMVTAGHASTALARGGFGGGHFGGGGHIGGFARPGVAFHGNHFVGRPFVHDRFGHFRHRFGQRFAVFPGGYYGDYGDSCYGRVWTPWGWRWQYVCY